MSNSDVSTPNKPPIDDASPIRPNYQRPQSHPIILAIIVVVCSIIGLFVAFILALATGIIPFAC